MKKNWSTEYNYCKKCYKTTYRHVFDGICKKCYHDMEQEKVSEEKERRCLKCDAVFLSKGPGNRKCKECLTKDNNSKYTDKHRHRVSIT